MDTLLQIWGGGFYLLNKILFALAEGRPDLRKQRLRIIGWTVYLVGVPAWVIILVGHRDWIAASIEAGGIPALVFGLVNASRPSAPPPKLLDQFAALCTYGFLVLGVGYSLYDYGGLSSLTQFLEIGVMIGFLLGSYLLAGKNSAGWIFFMVMNGSMATLMCLQHKPLLMIQQLVSLGFVIYGFSVARATAGQDG